MTELQEKIAKLPSWARAYIQQLENRPRSLEDRAGKLERDLAAEKRTTATLNARLETVREIMTAAGRAGNELATAYVERIASLYLQTPDQVRGDLAAELLELTPAEIVEELRRLVTNF